ncbi:hypothetical protein TNCT_659681 [Trichonephila clavata]|uniref:Uncharacterized protein n=1 Tax=Trichonephila clavata TaxID=2740835 RepID=A0A8X6LQY1_TRICU|nr:hypothetical protein TNCT_659681 [Trichonephila clavata]
MYKKCENYPAEEAINLFFAPPKYDPEVSDIDSDDETDEEFSIESGGADFFLSDPQPSTNRDVGVVKSFFLEFSAF